MRFRDAWDRVRELAERPIRRVLARKVAAVVGPCKVLKAWFSDTGGSRLMLYSHDAAGGGYPTPWALRPFIGFKPKRQPLVPPFAPLGILSVTLLGGAGTGVQFRRN